MIYQLSNMHIQCKSDPQHCLLYAGMCKNCSKVATCEKNEAFTCVCKAGYTGDGTSCEGIT